MWKGNFDGFPASSWEQAWGKTKSGTWGFENLHAVNDAQSPYGQVLEVTYGAGSSANSCKKCPSTGGGQFYTDLSQIGLNNLQSSPSLDLKYYIKFPANFDWGRAGKLPGLYGGPVSCESGKKHCGGWSTRYMWRNRKGVPNKGELYWYDPTAKGYGEDLGLGNWNFAADDKWHTIEQLVNRQTGTTTIWYDGQQVLQADTPNIANIPFSGIFFSTFFGGHDTSWGPKTTVSARFAAFTLSTGPQH